MLELARLVLCVLRSQFAVRDLDALVIELQRLLLLVLRPHNDSRHHSLRRLEGEDTRTWRRTSSGQP